jgi:hypothetical protein
MKDEKPQIMIMVNKNRQIDQKTLKFPMCAFTSFLCLERMQPAARGCSTGCATHEVAGAR